MCWLDIHTLAALLLTGYCKWVFAYKSTEAIINVTAFSLW